MTWRAVSVGVISIFEPAFRTNYRAVHTSPGYILFPRIFTIRIAARTFSLSIS